MGSRSQNPIQKEGDNASDTNILYSNEIGKERERRTHVATFTGDQDIDMMEISGNLPNRTLGVDDDAAMADFIKRPLKILEFQWEQNDDLVRYVDPIALFMQDARVRDKMNYWRNFRGELCFRIVMNGNPFYVGRLMVAWQPYRTVPLFSPTLAGRAEAIQLSQRMHVLIDPSVSEPVEMKLPFFVQEESINLTDNTQFGDFGQLVLFPLNLLRHTNGSTNAINVSIFSWFESYELGVPTRLPVQSPASIDERKTTIYKIASKSAGAVAQARKMAKKIEPYASALEKSTIALAKAAVLMGFSKPEKDTGESVVPFVTDDMANTDGKDAVHRLVADTKQGLTTDPRTVGMDGSDELDLLSIVTKESFFSTTNWTSGDSSNTLLNAFLVDPMMNFYNLADNNSHQFTPMGLAALSHRFWTGSIRYRIQIVSNNFQKGRLLVQYYPEVVLNTPTPTNLVYSHIIDISSSKETILEVGWSQNYAIRECASPDTTFDGLTGGVRMSDVTSSNGYLAIYVLNELVGPQSITDVDINVYVSGCDDMMFMAPTGKYIPRMSLNVPPAGYQSPAAVSEVEAPVRMGGGHPPDHIAHEYCGEQTISFRSLMKRYNYNSTIPIVTPSLTADRVAFHYVVPRYPASTRIYNDTSPQNPLDVLLVTGIYDQNVVTTIISLLGWCFAGTRGALRWAIHSRMTIGNAANGRDTSPSVILRVGRSEDYQYTATVAKYATGGTAPDTAREQYAFQTPETFQQGAINLAYEVNPMVKVETPFYSNLRFSQENRVSSYADHSIETLRGNSGTIGITGQFTSDINGPFAQMALDMYVSTGEDMTMIWFQGVPKLFFVTS